MRDYIFEEMLNRRANVTRPAVAVDADRLAREPEYQLVQAAAPLRLRPVRAALDGGLLGAFPQAESVAYTLPDTAQAYDRLGVIAGLTVLRSAVRVGPTSVMLANTTGVVPGQRLHLRDGNACEEVTVTAVLGPTVALRAALENDFAAGASAEQVESYEVLGAEDAAGAGHHLRLALRRR